MCTQVYFSTYFYACLWICLPTNIEEILLLILDIFPISEYNIP